MARRTLSEIYDAIALEKANMSTLNGWFTDKANPGSVLDDHQTLLSDLSSTSKVGIWRLFMFIVAIAIWTLEGLWYVFKKEVETDIDKHQAHTVRWYKEASEDFQYGDELIWNASKRRYEYELYDENKRIIKRSAAEEGKGIVAIKAATIINSELSPLTTPQKVAFEAYWKKYKDAGVIINIISENPDLLKLEYQIFYDPLVINEYGSLIANNAVFPVEDAINSYIETLDFNGRFRLEECDAAVRSAQGVVDFQKLSAKSKYGANSYSNIIVSLVAYSGYFVIDTEYPLTDLIDYTANV